MFSASEAEYLAKILVNKLQRSDTVLETEESQAQSSHNEEAKQDDDLILWAKALYTERCLKRELAWHKKLPSEVIKARNIRNLIKLILRVTRLFAARSAAVKILKALLVLKELLRNQEIEMTELHK